MGDYTKLSKSNIDKIFSLYKDEEILTFRPLSLGISNSNYEIITKNNKYLLKVSNDKNKSQVEDEMKILHFLKEKQYQFSIVPFQTFDNEYVYESDDFYGVLFPFVDGIPPGPGDSTCYEIGQALAKLHLIKGDTNHLRKSEELSYPPSVIFEYIQSPKCPEDFKQLFKELLGNTINEYLAIDFEKGIIHGDLYYDNTLFHNDHIEAVLDFEQSGVGEYISDIGISISGSCLEKGRISLALVESYLNGYQSVKKLTVNEEKFLTAAIILGLFSIAMWRIKRFKEGSLNPLLSDSYKELLYRAQLYKQMVDNQ